MESLVLDKNRYRVKECPCGKSNRDGKFVPYIDCDIYGYCHSCGETFLPPRNEQPLITQKPYQVKRNDEVMERISYIDKELLRSTLNKENYFIDYLHKLFTPEQVHELRTKYLIGGHNYWNKSTVFWQVDKEGKIRTGKVMVYDPKTGKRIKEPRSLITWIHQALKMTDFNLSQCFFGEHLIKDTKKPIAIAESEKTTIIASVFYPQFIWLASGGKEGLTQKKLKALYGRKVSLFPDLDAYADWVKVAEKLKKEIGFTKVFNVLELVATSSEKAEKLDLCDFLIRKNYINSLTFKDGNWINKQGYPMTFDLFGNDVDQETKNFIRQAELNPHLMVQQ